MKSVKTIEHLQKAVLESHEGPVLLFKHSTRCSLSDLAYHRLFSSLEKLRNIMRETYILDLVQFRSLSNQITEDFQVPHESPQVLIIKNGECVYEASHLEIMPQDIIEFCRDN